MGKYDLSILIPSRNEMFLGNTVENILKNIRGNTEIIIILDGLNEVESWIPEAPNVTVIQHNKSVGQRAATNEAARLSDSKYLMKIDAHCTIDEGMDVKMLAEMKDHWTMVPMMYNLHAFDWVCPEGHRIYQSPTPKACAQCGKPMTRDVLFQPRWGRKSCFYRFDKTLHFQYFGEFGNRPEGKPDIAPTMSLQGSCFMLTRDKYFELNICDENHGSWGQQGVEVACKTWLSGGEVMVNKKTWYSHMFRTQGGDFGFPYPLSGSDVDKARKYSRELFLEGKWDKAIHDLNWLLEKFKPVPDWHYSAKENMKPSKGIIYYTHHVGAPEILDKCREQIKKGMKEKHITSVSLKPLNFGNNIVLDLQGGYLTMAKQILTGLKASKADVVFFCEHDVLYHPSHFDFLPLRHDVMYYNTNVWRVRGEDGHSLYCNDLKQLSGLCAYRDVLITHYEKRVKMLEEKWQSLIDNPLTTMETNNSLFNSYVRAQGFEPGTHGRPERVDDLTCDSYQSKYPNLDIRHDLNTTPSRWNKEQFRNQRFTEGWTEKQVNELPGWKMLGEQSGCINWFLRMRSI